MTNLDDTGPVESAKYRGVYRASKGHSFFAQVAVQGCNHYVGSFTCAATAAEAVDQFLRSKCSQDKLRLKKSLNFPSAEEVAYCETREQARERGLNISGCNYQKEAHAFNLLQAAFAKSVSSLKYEIQRLSGASKADAIFMRKGCPEDCLLIQLKAASLRGTDRRSYFHFNRVSGYAGMVVVFVALEGGHIWAAAGHHLLRSSQRISVGCNSSTRFQVSDIGSFLVGCFANVGQFPHMSKDRAILQCSSAHRTEAIAHTHLDRLLQCIGMRLTCHRFLQSVVDSLLELDPFNGNWSTSHLRVQEKATRSDSGAVQVNLSRSGGVLGRVAYGKDDFDLLAACILVENKLEGLFLIPMPVLVEHGFAGNKAKATSIRLFPSWSPPKHNATKHKYAWQRDFFVDLRSWQGSNHLAPDICRQAMNLVLKTADAVLRKRCLFLIGCLEVSRKSPFAILRKEPCTLLIWVAVKTIRWVYV